MNIQKLMLQAGIVGCGGAGFPTHVKFSGKGIEYLLLNGAECEPLLRTDRYMMIHYADEIIHAADAAAKELGIPHCIVALKKGYTQEIAALQAAIERQHADITLHIFQSSFYPAGDEQIIVYEATGQVVPPAGIPLDVGCVVSNVATMYAVYEAMQGKPFIRKVLTVTGAVATPSVIEVPIGMPFEACIQLAGGTRLDQYTVISGGPMMGAVLEMDAAKQAVVTKTTSGIIVLPEDSAHAVRQEIPVQHMLNRAKSACIQCNFCTQLCPRNLIGHPLEPHKIMRTISMCSEMDSVDLNSSVIQSAALCCECGICELFACPMQLQPRRVNAIIKKQLGTAGIRYEKGAGLQPANPFRNERKTPTKRAAFRSGVGSYYDIEIQNFQAGDSNHVRLPLQQHIGAPCEPVVAVGDLVAQGQLIAACPEGKLGTNLHASIAGRVTHIGQSIEIRS